MGARVREIQPDDIAACAEILAGLPEWFALPESNQNYIAGLSQLPAVVAESEGRIVGFASLRTHYERSAEIEVMAVERSFQRHGIGKRLVGWVLARCRFEALEWLHVKTRGPATPDLFYERTRRFYRALGFDPLFESTTLWGPADAALILVRRVGPPGENESAPKG